MPIAETFSLYTNHSRIKGIHIMTTGVDHIAGGVMPVSRRVMNLANFVNQAARRHPERAGFIWGDRTWTWREIDGRISALASALRRKGIGKGDRVLVHSKNCNEMFESMFATF